MSTKRTVRSLVDDEDGGPGQLGGALGVDLGQVEPQLALGREYLVGLLEGDADLCASRLPGSDSTVNVELGLLRGRQRLIRGLRADRDQSGPEGGEFRSSSLW